MILFTTLDDDYSEARFPYNEEALKVIKSAPVHRWDASRKVWTVETSWVQLLAERFRRGGFDVAIDGEIWTGPPKPEVVGSPLAALLEALPANLRRPTYLALCRVLHPDAGGDTKWMQELNKAMGK
jgi:hypothetical protein